MMFETDYRGESPISDPDLHMLEPESYQPGDAPALTGHDFPRDLLSTLYRGAATDTLLRWYAGETVSTR